MPLMRTNSLRSIGRSNLGFDTYITYIYIYNINIIYIYMYIYTYKYNIYIYIIKYILIYFTYMPYIPIEFHWLQGVCWGPCPCDFSGAVWDLHWGPDQIHRDWRTFSDLVRIFGRMWAFPLMVLLCTGFPPCLKLRTAPMVWWADERLHICKWLHLVFILSL